MYSDRSIAALACRRAAGMRFALRRWRAESACAGVLGLAVSALLGALAAVVSPGDTPDAAGDTAAALFGNTRAGGYILVGLAAFTIGVTVALLCEKRKEKLRFRKGEKR